MIAAIIQEGNNGKKTRKRRKGESSTKGNTVTN